MRFDWPEKVDSGKPQIWSSGGGVQSSGIGAAICLGYLPVPDLAVMADTGREYGPVWEYMKRYVRPALREVGCELHIASHDLATVDLWSGKNNDTLIIPAYTDKTGTPGRMPKYCSQEWKTRVVQRFCRQHGITDADQWIGFTEDEIGRCRAYQHGKPWQHVYPLVNMRLRRSDCLRLVEEMGWPSPPPRSACYMCPFRSNSEWRLMQKESPDDFQKAVKFERYVQQFDPHAYLHDSVQPLDEVDFTAEQDMFADEKPCNSGNCFT